MSSMIVQCVVKYVFSSFVNFNYYQDSIHYWDDIRAAIMIVNYYYCSVLGNFYLCTITGFDAAMECDMYMQYKFS